jgi:hypothetical protein
MPEAAIGLYSRLLETSERTLGLDHEYTLEALDGLATAFAAAGDQVAAADLYHRLIEHRERTLGTDDPVTIMARLRFESRNLAPLEAAIRRGEPTAIRAELAGVDVYALGSVSGTAEAGQGTESDIIHVAMVDSDGSLLAFVPVFTQFGILGESLLRNPEWQTVDVLKVNGGKLMKGVEPIVTIVINPWSPLEFRLPPPHGQSDEDASWRLDDPARSLVSGAGQQTRHPVSAPVVVRVDDVQVVPRRPE